MNHMKRSFPFLGVVLALALSGCNERIIKTTSIALRVLLIDDAFNLDFVKSVQIFIESADPTKPLNPPETPAFQSSFAGINFEVQASDFGPDGGDGRRETRLTIARNPFVKSNPDALPAFTLLFDSKSAGRNPMKITVNVLNDKRVIATGVATETVQRAPINLIDDERSLVEVQVACASDFACDTGNQGPVLAPIGHQTLNEGETKTITASATDADGHAITYSLSANKPDFMTIDAATGAITLAPQYTHAGTYQGIVVTATDAGTPKRSASEIITVVVNNVNRAPTFTRVGDLDATGTLAFQARENEQLILRLTATDPDPTGTTLTYSMVGLPETAMLNPTTGLFQWTPAFDLVPNPMTEQSLTVTFTVTDSEAGATLSSSVTATITVRNINRAPDFTAQGAPTAQIASEGTALNFTLAATDPDGDAVTYSAAWVDTSVPDSLPDPSTALNATTGVFSWTPGVTDQRASPYKIRYTVSDGNGGLATRDSTIEVRNTNRAPSVAAVEATAAGTQRCTSTSGQLECQPNENETITLAITVTDDPEDTITDLSVSPNTLAGSSLVVAADKKSATFTWTTGYSVGGATQPITFSARDNTGATGTLTVPVTVADVNRAPILTLTERASGAPKCSGSDLLQCSMKELEVLTIDIATSDDPGETVGAPTLTLTSEPTSGGLYSLAQNMDGTYYVEFIPGGRDAVGSQTTEYIFKVSATDNKGTTTEKEVLVRVSNNNSSPVISFTGISATLCPTGDGSTGNPFLCTINEGEAFSFPVTVTDADTDDTINLLSMDQSPTGTGASFVTESGNKAASFSWTPGFQQGGTTATPKTYTFTFSAQDSQGTTTQGVVKVKVKNVNRAPTVTLTSGTVNATSVCKGTSNPGEVACFIDSPSRGETTRADTLVVRFTVSDPDNNTVTVKFIPENLPQLGPVFDAAQRIFSFTPPLTGTPPFYTATFEATDDDADEPKTTSARLIIYVNASNSPPILTRFQNSCPSSVPAGQSVLCSLSIDDVDPRDTDLAIESSFINGGSFSFNGPTRIGTFVMVPPLTDSGTFQVDFTGNDGETTVTDHYIFHVDRSDIATPISFPVINATIDDMVYAPPYLYTANQGFVSSYNVVSRDQINQPSHRLIPAGTRALRIDTTRNWLLVLGEALKVYDLQQGLLTTQLARYNIPDGLASTTFAVRTTTTAPSGDGGGAPTASTYAYVGFASLNQIDVIRLETCSGVASLLCPLRTQSLKNAVSFPSTFARFEIVGSYLLAIGKDGIAVFRISGTDQTISWLSNITPPTGVFYGTPAGAVRRADIDVTGLPPTQVRITIPAHSTSPAWKGFVDITADTTSGSWAGITHSCDGLACPPASPGGSDARAVKRIGTFNFVAAGDNDLRRYTLAGALQGTISLTGSADDLVSAGSIALVSGGGQLAAIDVSSPGSPVKGAERAVSGAAIGEGALHTFTNPSTQAQQLFLYLPRADSGVEVFDVTNPSPANQAVNQLGNNQLFVQRAFMHGNFLFAHATDNGPATRKHVVAYDASTNAVTPTEATPLGFAFAASSGAAVPFTGTGGQRYIYYTGGICKPACTAPADVRGGNWLLELTAGGIELRNNLDGMGKPISITLQTGGPRSTVIAGTTLYTTLESSGTRYLVVFDVSNPLSPTHVGEDLALTINLGSNPRICYGDNVLALLGSAGREVSIFLQVDDANPHVVTIKGTVQGIGDAIAGAIQTRNTAYLSSTKVGVVRIDLTDIQRPRIAGGQEAPGNAVTSMVLHTPATKRCCTPFLPCVASPICTTDAQCTAGQQCRNPNLLLTLEPSNVTLFELY
jgi:hypothetical protein